MSTSNSSSGAAGSRMLLAWTTVGNRADAERLAADVIVRNLAVCVQIDGPIVSYYRWKGQQERAEEYRLCIKLLDSHARALREHVHSSHPYDTPEWIVVAAADVGEKYLSWAAANSSTPPL